MSISARRSAIRGRVRASCACAIGAVAVLGVGASVVAAVLPASAGAYSTVGPEASFSAAPGLPDERVYEEVSPPNKFSNEVGARAQEGRANYFGDSVARADGNAVFFGGSGGLGEAVSGVDNFYVAQRSSSGWTTRSALPRVPNLEGSKDILEYPPLWVDPAADLSHVLFTSQKQYVPSPPLEGWPGIVAPAAGAGIFLEGSDPLLSPTWVGEPRGGSAVTGAEGSFGIVPLGGSPDLSTFYFAFGGNLGLPEDASREPTSPGIYEYSNGALSYAGVLPDGTVSQSGSTTAATGLTFANVDAFENEVSSDGSRVFFLSSVPAGSGSASEIFVHETAADGSQSTVLVSRDTLLPAVDGLPVGAPDGASFLYASPDGSHVFFTSSDQLTGDGGAAGVYDFDVDTNSLSYLPGVSGEIVVSSADGSRFVFNGPGGASLWAAGVDGGAETLTPIAPVAVSRPARVTSDGSVFVFGASELSGFNDAGPTQLFRYDALSNELSCVSCPPAGVTPSGEAVLSNLAKHGNHTGESGARNGAVDDHGISSDGSRIFFDTPDPLVPQDTNGKRDVYEWENGRVFLISSGTSAVDSLFLDNNPSGSDVFFATNQGLVPGDTEGGFDVYDARIPHPGDNPPASAVPCQGDVCQGPPSVPSLLGAPSSATFNGLGNLTPETAPAAKPKAKTILKCAKAKKLSKGKCVKAAAKAKKKARAKKAKKTANTDRRTR